MQRLDPKRLGLAAGIVWRLSLFVATLISTATGYGAVGLNAWGSFHPGYSISGSGSIIALIYGFICGFIALYALAWLYNWLEGV